VLRIFKGWVGNNSRIRACPKPHYLRMAWKRQIWPFGKHRPYCRCQRLAFTSNHHSNSHFGKGRRSG